MNQDLREALPRFMDTLGLDEEPMGIIYTHEQPAEGLSPKPLDLPTREREMQGKIDWGKTFRGFSCVMGHIWRARKKKTAAYFDSQRFGCPGGAFWLGFMKPQTETIIHYISSGIPDQMPGELYCASPDELRRIFEEIDPTPAPGPYCVVKPLSQFASHEEPLLISFFARPETMCGLHQLATFVTNDQQAVASPWGAACTNIFTWPLKYLQGSEKKAVLGGWDPSARQFFKTDEISFTVPHSMFQDMLRSYEGSFLSTKTWGTVQKKIRRSKRAWGEAKDD